MVLGQSNVYNRKPSMAVNYQYSRYEINMAISSDNQHGFFNIDNQIFVNSQRYKFQH